MTNQLVLLENHTASWRIDEATRATGRRGVAEARATLRAARVRAANREAERTDGSPIVRADAA